MPLETGGKVDNIQIFGVCFIPKADIRITHQHFSGLKDSNCMPLERIIMWGSIFPIGLFT